MTAGKEFGCSGMARKREGLVNGKFFETCDHWIACCFSVSFYWVIFGFGIGLDVLYLFSLGGVQAGNMTNSKTKGQGKFVHSLWILLFCRSSEADAFMRMGADMRDASKQASILFQKRGFVICRKEPCLLYWELL